MSASELVISDDKEQLDIPLIHRFLTETYWANGRTEEEVRTTVKHSLCFGGYLDGQQIAFARVISDQLVFAYLMDVFVLPEHCGNGYATKLLRHVIECPRLKKVSKWLLKTQDAAPLYRKFGFDPIDDPEVWMSRSK